MLLLAQAGQSLQHQSPPRHPKLHEQCPATTLLTDLPAARMCTQSSLVAGATDSIQYAFLNWNRPKSFASGAILMCSVASHETSDS
eukprot:2138888-Amphidinium_carterae.1